jgi:hypothetical protein
MSAATATVPFLDVAPLVAAVERRAAFAGVDTHRGGGRDIDRAGRRLLRAYGRAKAAGRIRVDVADEICVARLGSHLLELWPDAYDDVAGDVEVDVRHLDVRQLVAS